jgi:predicted deacylase
MIKINLYIQNVMIIIIIIIITFIIYNKCNDFKDYTFTGILEGYNILIIGGTHGNEPSGSEALHYLKKNIKNGNINIKNGTLTIIPDVNYCGLKTGIRWNPGNILHPDINRSYSSSKEEESKCYISQKIKNIVDKSDFILDLHEGYDFYHNNPKSIGSTISPGPTELSLKISKDMKFVINENIQEYKKKFHIIEYNEKDSIKGTLSEYCKSIDKDYILIETSGQGNIQPLKLRVDQMSTMITILLKNLQIIL